MFKGHRERETYWRERSDDQSASRCRCEPGCAIRVTQHCPESRTRADQNQGAVRIVDMSASNSWAEFAGLFRNTRGSARWRIPRACCLFTG